MENTEKNAPLLQEVRLMGAEMLSALRKLVHDTSVRRLILKNSDGKLVLDLPLVIGLAGALVIPFWAMMALVFGSARGYTVLIERDAEVAAPMTPPPPAEPRVADRPQA